jgi:hypothetical protein
VKSRIGKNESDAEGVTHLLIRHSRDADPEGVEQTT